MLFHYFADAVDGAMPFHDFRHADALMRVMPMLFFAITLFIAMRFARAFSPRFAPPD